MADAVDRRGHTSADELLEGEPERAAANVEPLGELAFAGQPLVPFPGADLRLNLRGNLSEDGALGDERHGGERPRVKRAGRRVQCAPVVAALIR